MENQKHVATCTQNVNRRNNEQQRPVQKPETTQNPGININTEKLT